MEYLAAKKKSPKANFLSPSRKVVKPTLTSPYLCPHWHECDNFKGHTRLSLRLKIAFSHGREIPLYLWMWNRNYPLTALSLIESYYHYLIIVLHSQLFIPQNINQYPRKFLIYSIYWLSIKIVVLIHLQVVAIWFCLLKKCILQKTSNNSIWEQLEFENTSVRELLHVWKPSRKPFQNRKFYKYLKVLNLHV